MGRGRDPSYAASEDADQEVPWEGQGQRLPPQPSPPSLLHEVHRLHSSAPSTSRQTNDDEDDDRGSDDDNDNCF